MQLIPATSAPFGQLSDWWMPDDAPNARIARSARVGDSTQVCGSARVYDEARVYGSARVCGEARICGDGDIADTTDYLVIGPIGTHQDWITLHRDRKLGIRIVTGCWSGTLWEFMARLTRRHTNYKGLIPVAYRVLQARIKRARRK